MEKSIKEIASRLKEADAVLIGASNGLSITEGLHLFAENEAFIRMFGDFRRKYGIRSILQGAMFRFPTDEEYWAFWSRLIWRYSFEYEVSENMKAIQKLVDGKPYFIVTSNGEGHFEAAGFEPQNIYEVEGNWLGMQCVKACHDKVYPTKEAVEKMAEAEKDGMVPTKLLPRCPVCGAVMRVRMAGEPHFIEDQSAMQNYRSFLNRYHGKKLFILELGIGWRNQLIKAPLMNLCRQEEKATYVTVNKGEVYIREDIKEKSYGLDGDMTEILAMLCRCMGQV